MSAPKNASVCAPACFVPQSDSLDRARSARWRHRCERLIPPLPALVTMRELFGYYHAPTLSVEAIRPAVDQLLQALRVPRNGHTSHNDGGAWRRLRPTAAASPGRTAVSSPATGSVPHRCVAP